MNIRTNQIRRVLAAIGVASLCCLSALAQTPAVNAAPQQPSILFSGGVIDLTVHVHQSRVISLNVPANRVSVGSPEVADIVVISPTQVYVLGKDPGETNVLLWDRSNELIGTINVSVQADLDGLRRLYAELLPKQAIQVRASQRSIVLSGSVDDAQTMNAAVRIAATFLPQTKTTTKSPDYQQSSDSPRDDKSGGQIINLLQVGGSQQVMLEVKVAEIARTELKRLNAQFNALGTAANWALGGLNGGASFPKALFGSSGQAEAVFPGGMGSGSGLAGPAIAEFLPTPASIPNAGLFASFLSKSMLFNLALDAAKQQGLARILADPTLTTLSGQEATFLSGGEFPIPVPQGNNTVTIVFKEYGISVKFLPVVLASGHINLKLDVAVSELDSGNTVSLAPSGTQSTFVIPALTKRSASGVVELGDGQTIGLAGMLNESTRTAITKFPGLGSIPILGALFRSQSYINGETELVILITPRLAKPLPTDHPRLPTDSYVAPSDADFYLRGLVEGKAPVPK